MHRGSARGLRAEPGNPQGAQCLGGEDGKDAVPKCDEVGKGRGWGALGTHTERPRGW